MLLTGRKYKITLLLTSGSTISTFAFVTPPSGDYQESLGAPGAFVFAYAIWTAASKELTIPMSATGTLLAPYIDAYVVETDEILP